MAAQPVDRARALPDIAGATAMESVAQPPALPMPPRPARPLWSLGLMRVGLANTLAMCDEELFDQLFVERRFYWGRVVVVSDPDGIKRILQDNIDNYPRIEPIRRVFEFATGTGMLCAEGEAWRRHRRLLNSTLDRRAALADVPALVTVTEELAQFFENLPSGQAFSVAGVFGRLLTRSSRHVFAGGDPAVDPLLHRMGSYPGAYGIADFLSIPRWLRFIGRFGRSRAEAKALHPLLERMITERRSPSYAGGEDLLWRLATAQDRDTGDTLSVAEIEDEALTLASTSVTSLRVYNWLWYLLALHPEVEAKVTAELDAVLGDRSPTAADLAKLVYTRQVIDETMRLYPPLPIMLRSAAAEDVVCGRRIRRKSVVAVMPWVIHRHRKLWPDPDGFDPDRFDPEQVRARSRYSYLPFSLGPHVCIGLPLAMTEILITVAVLARRLRFRLVPGQRIEPMAWTSLRPGQGIKMTVERRPMPERARAPAIESAGPVS